MADAEIDRPRGRTPGAELAVLLVSFVVFATAFLPSNGGDRTGISATALLLLAFGLTWFRILPRGVFGDAHFAVGLAFTVALAAALLWLTGRSASPYYAIYLLSLLGSVFAVRPRTTIAAGVAAITLYALMIGLDALSGAVTMRQIEGAVIGLAGLAGATFFGALVTRAIRRTTDELQLRSIQMQSLATTDSLTGLRNRNVLNEHLGLIHAIAERTGRPYAVLAIDVDELKKTNDARGHAAGDQALRYAGDAIRLAVRGSDVPMRVGGDEFLVLLPETRSEEAAVVAERIRRGLPREGPERATFSVGVADWRVGLTAELVLKAADAALYRAKERGRDIVVVAESPRP